MIRKFTCVVICCLLFGMLFSGNVFGETLPVEQEKVENYTFITTVIVPLTAPVLGALLGGFFGWLVGRKQFKKELAVEILPEKNSFIVYNIGNSNVNAQKILLFQKHWLNDVIIYSKQITENNNISNNVNPILYKYDEGDFFAVSSNWIHESEERKFGNKIYCKLIDIKGRSYKSKSKYLSDEIKEYHNNYWHPDSQNEADDSDCPF